MFLYKGDSKSIQIDFLFNANTLVSGLWLRMIMLEKVQFMLVEARLKVLILLMSLLFDV